MLATRSDLTPRQGATIDTLPDTWTVCGRADDELTMDMAPNPYPDPPILVYVTDPHGITWRIDRKGNLRVA